MHTVVRATRLVNGTPRYLDPKKSETPKLIDMKLDWGDYVGDITPHANFGIFTPKGAVLHMLEILIPRVYFLHPRYFLILCAPVEIAPFD